MEQHITLHIVGGSSRSRAEQARLIYARGIHAELYADLDELVVRQPDSGLIVMGGELLDEGIAACIDRLGEAGIWLPIVAVSEEPKVEQIVEAMKQGAFDYFALPIEHAAFDRLLARIGQGEAAAHVKDRRARVEARNKIAQLSRRERQVLDWLCEGSSNKHIARELDISPRTVEIHRANMMNKLGAQHSSEVVRLQCIADLQSTAREEEPALPDVPDVTAPGVAMPIEPIRPAASEEQTRTRAA